MINADVEGSGAFVVELGGRSLEDWDSARLFSVEVPLALDPLVLPMPALDFFFLVIAVYRALPL